MKSNQKPVTELDMMYLRAGWAPMSEEHALKLAQPIQCRACRAVSRVLKSLATRLDDYAIRVEHT